MVTQPVASWRYLRFLFRSIIHILTLLSLLLQSLPGIISVATAVAITSTTLVGTPDEQVTPSLKLIATPAPISPSSVTSTPSSTFDGGMNDWQFIEDNVLNAGERNDNANRGMLGNGATWVIRITSTGFEPAMNTVLVGTAVVWLNATNRTHILQSGNSHRLFLPIIQQNANGNVASTSAARVSPGQRLSDDFITTLAPGQAFTHTFTTAGDYPYFLATAPQLTGRIIVQEPPTTLTPTPTSSPTVTPTPIATATSTTTPTPTATATATSTPTATDTVTPTPDLCQDAYEPDNSAAQARAFAIGSTEAHAFCLLGDQDWIFFTVTTPASYRIETLNLARDNDTVLELYRGRDMERIAFDDDGGGDVFASLIIAQLTEPGTYYIKVHYYDDFDGQPCYTYDLRITQD